MGSNFKGWSAESVKELEAHMLDTRIKAKAAKQQQVIATRKRQPEYEIQAEFVDWMDRLYPDVPVFSDTAAHIKKTKMQQIRANRLSSKGRKWPDMFIAQPSGDYAGMYIEWKAETPYRKDGSLKKNEHIEEQFKTMQELSAKGYFCVFAWEVKQGLEIVTRYLNI
jgi:hypothetical protein